MMGLPGFIAEEAVVGLRNIHRARWSGLRCRGVSPALQKQGGQNLLDCRSDCYDKCTELGHVPSAMCRNQCIKRCRDLGIAGTSDSNAIDCFLSKAGCY